MAGIGTNTRLWLAAALALVAGLAVGAGAGWFAWGREPDWYAYRDIAGLPSSPENELIQYGLTLVVDTPQNIGPLASEPAMRFAGNKLACTNCHLDAGLQPFSAPYVSTFATYPRMEMDTVETLTERINGCLTNSMNGRMLPAGSREMNALIAYIQYLGVGSPEGVRVAGMGLLPLAEPLETADPTRGAQVFAGVCARCHGANGAGEEKAGGGYAIPPLWGSDSFNAAAGMNTLPTAAAFIRANMPRGITWQEPQLTVQEAWDVAAYVLSQPRPPAPGAQTE
jgi:thiosulfate dehydrogenase